jgi:hypothetical protein
MLLTKLEKLAFLLLPARGGGGPEAALAAPLLTSSE